MNCAKIVSGGKADAARAEQVGARAVSQKSPEAVASGLMPDLAGTRLADRLAVIRQQAEQERPEHILALEA